jgi:GNAT superfamily N-acetyltransferase
MMKFTLHPPILPSPGSGPFVQTITLADGGTTIGLARWHTSSDTAEGVVQLLDLYVEPPHQRKGHGGKLFKELVAQSSSYFKLHRSRLRRIWAALEQKRHINARAFLTASGFHHVVTMKDLFRDQDQLLYSRSFD